MNHNLQQERSGSEERSQGVLYVCPMHPEIRQKDPGICPICGMKLAPEAGPKSKKNRLNLKNIGDIARRCF